MALDERYVPQQPLRFSYLNPITGLPLVNGTVEFYRDTARTTPKTVYQLTGTPPDYTYTALPNPVQLDTVGAYINAGNDPVMVYFYPYDEDGEIDRYYCVVKDDVGNIVATVPAQPNLTSGNDPTNSDFQSSNQISNPQFTRVLINEDVSTVYTVSGATNERFEFAPNWFFEISGTGSVTIQRVAVAGLDNVVTSPPYVLDVSVSSGVSECKLVQRFDTNSGLWASTDADDIYLSATMVARNESAGSVNLGMYYEESVGTGPIQIMLQKVDNSAYALLQDASADPINSSINTQTGENGYVDVYVAFPINSHVRISSIQVIPVVGSADLLGYDINSSNREQAYMGDYYIPALETKPISSILTGWDFNLNPYQLGTSGNITTTPAYICDQTIAASLVANPNFIYATAPGNLNISTTVDNEAFYVMQYLEDSEAKKILQTRLSVNICGFKDSAGTNPTMRVYLLRAPSTSSIPALPTSVGTVNAAGEFTITAAGWTEIPRSGLGTPVASLTSPNSSSYYYSGIDYGFSGWAITDSAQYANTTKFAIVVTFSVPTAATVVSLKSISVVPGDIPTRPAIQTLTDVENECYYYYETTYSRGVPPGTTGLDPRHAQQGSAVSGFGNVEGYGTVISQTYVGKRVPPTLTIYNPTTGAASNLVINAFTGGVQRGSVSVASTNWTFTTGVQEFVGLGNHSGALISVSDGGVALGDYSYVLFHFVADSRLGVV